MKKYLFATVAAIALLPGVSRAEMSLVRIATMPDGAEVTGISTNAIGDLFLNAQHPGGKNTFKDDAPAALVGYVARFDAASPGMPIPPEDQRADLQVNSGQYVTFGKAGDALGSGEVFGGVYDAAGALMYVSNAPDFNGFVPTGANTAYLYTGWEGAGRDGASAISKVALSRRDGVWQADLSQSKMLDLSSVHGGGAVFGHDHALGDAAAGGGIFLLQFCHMEPPGQP
ncbi:hypothetical protein [Sulfitobacter aestuariivivens]|uniref:hypothetical protein n=1 Tax=Sulfitobacter aestuariivivens TaxID=2766981 RepID=UPI003622A245